jgi:hypothetical protein
MAKRSLADVLRKALSTQKKSLRDSLDAWQNKKLTLEDASGLASVLGELQDGASLVNPESHGEYSTPLADLAILFQSDVTQDAREVLAGEGLPELARLSQSALSVSSAPAHPFTIVAKMFAMYAYEPGFELIAGAVGRFPDEYLWSIVFNIAAGDENPLGPWLAERLADSLPEGFATVALLDMSNTLSRQNRLESHPFNNPNGLAKLEAWLTSSDPGEFSYAHSATAALPFMDAAVRNKLAALAMDHPDSGVQMEAAWATAYKGSTAGLKFLARMCEQPQTSAVAREYLTELGHEDRIPASSLEPDFEAMSAFCRWLSHPNEFGRPPNTVEVADSREIFWPPTKDTRWLWVLKYRYDGIDGEPDDIGYGMVGSITFALFGETTADLSPEDVYALHCCWELEMNEDKRAPKKRSVGAGRKLLGW